MKPAETSGLPLFTRVVLIGCAIAGAASLIPALESVASRRRGALAEEVPLPKLTPAARTIPAEADVFRTGFGDPAGEPATDRRSAAHPRTLATFRSLRAYPGAPPRVPHGLTGDEFRGAGCTTCHERGGYSQRFAAYTPVTPHPELRECLQCHATDAAVVGVALSDGGPDALCRQCHRPGASATPRVAMDWRPAPWPAVTASVRGAVTDGAPPPIPHDLAMRGNCTACHTGLAAVAEIRTTHPERTNCRQCHVTAEAEAAEFTRPVAAHNGGRP